MCINNMDIPCIILNRRLNAGRKYTADDLIVLDQSIMHVVIICRESE
jgi:hypothetical protein